MPKKKKTKVSVPEVVDHLPVNPIEDELDLTHLKNDMIRGIYSLESSLYKQATEEQNRLNKLRKCIGNLEDEIFSPEFVAELTDKSKLFMYKIASENMQNIVNFMMSLHKTTSDGVNVINQIEALKNDSSPKKKGTESELDFARRVQDMVKEKLIEKIKKNEEENK